MGLVRCALCGASLRWAVVLMLGLVVSGEAARAGGLQDFGDCDWHLVDDVYYDEAFRAVGGDAGLYAPTTHLMWTSRHLFGAQVTMAPASARLSVLSESVLAEVGGGFWIVERGAANDAVERFPSYDGWRARLDQLGVPRTVRLRHVKDLQSPLSWLGCRAEQLAWLSIIFGPLGLLAALVLALTGGSCFLIGRKLSRWCCGSASAAGTATGFSTAGTPGTCASARGRSRFLGSRGRIGRWLRAGRGRRSCRGWPR